jgi:hypothetical protein
MLPTPGAATVIVAVARFVVSAFAMAVIVEPPTATAVTSPVEPTVATLVLLERSV